MPTHNLDDDRTFIEFCKSGHAMIMAGLEFAKRNDPELYQEVVGIVSSGRAKPVLRVEFDPVSVSMHIETPAGDVVGECFKFVADRLEKRATN